MGIHIGTQIVAPAGYKELQQGNIYYFLYSDNERERVHVIEFVIRPLGHRKSTDGQGIGRTETPTPLAVLVAMRRATFEHGIDIGAIIPCKDQASLPPWLEPLAGKNLASIDFERLGAKKSHATRIDDMIEVIYPLVIRCERVLGAADPDKTINDHARSCTPKKNETRVRLAFYCYMLFGRNRNALHYPIHKIGHWDRDKDLEGNKRGRPSNTKGKGNGHNIGSKQRQLIVAAYNKYAALGVSMTSIYENAIPRTFGCLERKAASGMLQFFHPEGMPFPTFGQFRAHVVAELGKDEIQERRLGPRSVRQHIAPSLGPFTQSVANLMERVEADGYVVGERPKGLVDGSTLKSLVVVRRRDYASGAITGISFSFGSERAKAYRMASFCEAISKVKFCALFGMTIDEDEWPTIGASPHGIADRGPGSTDGGYTSDPRYQPVFRTIPPSHAGQSKAVVESSNPKKLKNLEAPSHLKSEKNVFQLVLRELRQVLIDNDSFDISDRITPDLWDKIRKPSPNALWTVLDSLGRNDAIQMTFDDAVRAYLDRTDVTVRADGVYLHDQRYDSEGLRATKLLDKVAVTQRLHLDAFVLEACVRHIWIDIDHQLVQLDMQVALRVGNDMLYMSLDELKAREEEMKLTSTEFAEHRHATSVKQHRAYKEDTGLNWNGADRQAGRPKSGTKTAVLETAETYAVTHGRMRA